MPTVRRRRGIACAVLLAVSLALAGCDDGDDGDGGGSSSDGDGRVAATSTSSSPSVGISGKPLPPELSRWADAFFSVVGRLSSVGEGPPDEQDDRCRERVSEMPATLDALDDPPDKTLDDLQDQYVDALDDYYRACADEGTNEETARLLRKTTEAGTKIYDRLRQLDVPASTG